MQISTRRSLHPRTFVAEYFEVVQKALENPACYGVIKNGIIATQTYLAAGSTGISKVQKDFKYYERKLRKKRHH